VCVCERRAVCVCVCVCVCVRERDVFVMCVTNTCGMHLTKLVYDMTICVCDGCFS